MKTRTFFREPEEILLIGDDVQVKVVAVKGKKVTLDVTTPREIQVDRKEIREARDARLD